MGAEACLYAPKLCIGKQMGAKTRLYAPEKHPPEKQPRKNSP